MFTTACAIILILIGASMDLGECSKSHHMPKFRITNYFLGLGTLLFSYGGHSAFPTIQHDMRKPSEFSKSTILAFASMFLLPSFIVGISTSSFAFSFALHVCSRLYYGLRHVW